MTGCTRTRQTKLDTDRPEKDRLHAQIDRLDRTERQTDRQTECHARQNRIG